MQYKYTSSVCIDFVKTWYRYLCCPMFFFYLIPVYERKEIKNCRFDERLLMQYRQMRKFDHDLQNASTILGGQHNGTNGTAELA